ncbi:hypothetical protein TIFTF001_013600 [Ficus carica]|uniref:Uncharacterized protein n=1 Tax=Ficus carica TaxID=3494 RepID=A0AA87ZV73_FICCA|nr:hypothetical protein TIFTF001_013600 [Ficus carica]
MNLDLIPDIQLSNFKKSLYLTFRKFPILPPSTIYLPSGKPERTTDEITGAVITDFALVKCSSPATHSRDLVAFRYLITTSSFPPTAWETRRRRLNLDGEGNQERPRRDLRRSIVRKNSDQNHDFILAKRTESPAPHIDFKNWFSARIAEVSAIPVHRRCQSGSLRIATQKSRSSSASAQHRQPFPPEAPTFFNSLVTSSPAGCTAATFMETTWVWVV